MGGNSRACASKMRLGLGESLLERRRRRGGRSVRRLYFGSQTEGKGLAHSRVRPHMFSTHTLVPLRMNGSTSSIAPVR